MANRNYRSQFSYGYAGQPVTLRAKVSIGAAGAPTIQSSTGMAITSITRNSAGDYSILLSEPYASLMRVQAIFQSGASAPAAPGINIRTDAVSTAAAPIVRITCRNLSGTATDPASGEVMYIAIELNNSSTGY